MSDSEISRLQLVIKNLERRAHNVTLMATVIGGFSFFVGSYTSLINNLTFTDRLVFVFVGAVFGSIYGVYAKRVLEDQRVVTSSLLKMLSHLEEKVKAKNIITNTQEIEEVVIPSQPKLPDIPSVSVPAEVKEVLRSARGKGKPTKLPPKRKPKPEPPTNKQ